MLRDSPGEHLASRSYVEPCLPCARVNVEDLRSTLPRSEDLSSTGKKQGTEFRLRASIFDFAQLHAWAPSEIFIRLGNFMFLRTKKRCS